jgi:bacterioferritin-associated ferredoxin
MLLCLCKGVPDRVVRLAVINGATTIDAVSARCGAGTDCGACVPMIHDLIQEAAEEAAGAGARGHHAGHGAGSAAGHDAGHGQPCCEGESASSGQQIASAGA